jgi:hypothetical protein
VIWSSYIIKVKTLKNYPSEFTDLTDVAWVVESMKILPRPVRFTFKRIGNINTLRLFVDDYRIDRILITSYSLRANVPPMQFERFGDEIDFDSPFTPGTVYNLWLTAQYGIENEKGKDEEVPGPS